MSGNTLYVMAIHAYDSNAILMEPIRNRKGPTLDDAHRKLHCRLTNAGLRPRVLMLDNECGSNAFKEFLTDKSVAFQLTSAGMHRRNTVARAIRTAKNHFIARLYTVHPKFPLYLWDKLIPQAVGFPTSSKCQRLPPSTGLQPASTTLQPPPNSQHEGCNYQRLTPATKSPPSTISSNCSQPSCRRGRHGNADRRAHDTLRVQRHSSHHRTRHQQQQSCRHPRAYQRRCQRANLSGTTCRCRCLHRRAHQRRQLPPYRCATSEGGKQSRGEGHAPGCHLPRRHQMQVAQKNRSQRTRGTSHTKHPSQSRNARRHCACHSHWLVT